MARENGKPATIQPGLPKLPGTPAGWRKSRLGKHLFEIKRPVDLCPDKTYKLVTVKRARGGIEKRCESLGCEIKTPTQFTIQSGDFLISKRQIVHGACGLVPSELDGSIVSNEYAVIGTHGGIDLSFLRYLSETVYFQQTCYHSSIGIHVEKMIFNVERWLNWHFNIPTLLEQTKIVEMLASWDSAIATVRRLLENSKVQKRGLLQQLLSQKTRFADFGIDWQEMQFNSIASLSKERFNPSLSDKQHQCIELEHIEQGTGRLCGYTKTNAKSSLKAIFSANDVLFGKLRSYLQKYWMADREGVCSTEFWVLRANPIVCLPEYLFYLVQTEGFLRAVNVASGSKMPRAEWGVVSKNQFLLPPLEEQHKIAGLLKAVDTELFARQNQLVMLNRERQALLQQLLTGRRLVKVDDSPIDKAVT